MNYYKKSITDVAVKGRRVLVRCDLNTPQDDQGNVTDATRIVAALPTIKYLSEQGARVVLCTHLGRPKGTIVPEFSLKPIALETQKLLGLPITLSEDVVGECSKRLVSTLADGEIMMMENVRFEPGEEKNDPEFSKKLSQFGDIYVNEAFGTAHRAHCSTAGVAALLPAYCGFLMQKELDTIGGALTAPARPFVGILGGSKVSDKIMVIENLLSVCDALIIGGAMSYTFIKAQGGSIGKSLCEDDKLSVALSVIKKAAEKGVKLYLPTDHMVAAEFKADSTPSVIKGDNIPSNMLALDIGPATIDTYVSVIKSAKTIVWNGPMGVFEFDAFSKGTFSVAHAVASSGALSIIGGGDSVAAVKLAGIADQISHISTGGGASLKLLEGEKLPGVACLLDK